jgi:HPt (histidine-containing phosphotransfer) domain-containing protein
MVEQTPQDMIKAVRDAIATYGVEFMMEVIDIYLADAPRRLVDLRQAYASCNGEAFTRAAHTLKSSSAYVGAKHFSDLAKAVELASRQGAVADLGDQVARLEAAYVQVKAALEEVRNGR